MRVFQSNRAVTAINITYIIIQLKDLGLGLNKNLSISRETSFRWQLLIRVSVWRGIYEWYRLDRDRCVSAGQRDEHWRCARSSMLHRYNAFSIGSSIQWRLCARVINRRRSPAATELLCNLFHVTRATWKTGIANCDPALVTYCRVSRLPGWREKFCRFHRRLIPPPPNFWFLRHEKFPAFQDADFLTRVK